MRKIDLILFGALLLVAVVGSLYEGDVPPKGPMGPMPTQAKFKEPEPEPTSRFEAIDTEQARQCLAINTYYEARNQSKAGRLATMQVVVNRTYSHHFPDNVCDVVTQGPTYTNWLGNEWPVRDKCQFSWYCDGQSDTPLDAETYFEIQELVDEFMSTEMLDFTDEALYYHADYVQPYWKDLYTVTTVIDNHIFYKR